MRPTASWAALGRLDSWGKWSFPSAQRWWDTRGVLGPALFSPPQGTHELTVLSSEEPLRWLRNWSLCHLGRGWEGCNSAAWRRECSEKSYPMCKYLMRYLFCRRQSWALSIMLLAATWARGSPELPWFLSLSVSLFLDQFLANESFAYVRIMAVHLKIGLRQVLCLYPNRTDYEQLSVCRRDLAAKQVCRHTD